MVLTASSSNQEARDLERLTEGLDAGEEMKETAIKIWGVGDKISDISRLERFVVTTRERYPGMLGISKMRRATEVVQTLQMPYSDLEKYVNRRENSRVLFTAVQANQLYRKLNSYVDRSKAKQNNKGNKELVSLQFIEKLL